MRAYLKCCSNLVTYLHFIAGYWLKSKPLRAVNSFNSTPLRGCLIAVKWLGSSCLQVYGAQPPIELLRQVRRLKKEPTDSG
jgi:hypothetical protein